MQVSLFAKYHLIVAESAAGTDVTTTTASINASPTPGSAGTGNVLTITTGGQIANNGQALGGSGVTELYYIDHTAFQFGGGNWWGPITATSTGNPSPVTTPKPTIILSNNTFTSGNNATVGTINVTTGLPNGSIGNGAYTWALSLSGTNASSFQIVGNTLETNGTVGQGTYTINIIATNAAVIGSPFTLPSVTITGSSPVTGLTTRMIAFNGFPTATSQTVNGHFTTVMAETQTMYGYASNQGEALSAWPTGGGAPQTGAGLWATNYIPKIEIPMFLGSTNNPTVSDTNFQNIINDASNGNVWKNAIVGLINNWKNNYGKTLVYVAPGWEFNIPTGCAVSPSNAAHFVAAFQQIAGWVHAIPGVTVKVIWAPNDGDFSPTKTVLSACWPGTPAVDVVGIDIYGLGGDATPSRNFGTTYAAASAVSGYSITTAFLFAQQFGLTVAFNETGAAPTDSTFPANLQTAVVGFIHQYKVPVECVELWDANAAGGNLIWDNNGTVNTVTNAWKACWQAIKAASASP